MSLSSLGGSPDRAWLYADAAAAIPGMLLASKRLEEAGAALEFLAKVAADAGAMPVSAADASSDPVGNLWLIRASHLYAEAGGDKALAERLLQLSKRILQDVIAGRGLRGVKMDDGGLLSLSDGQAKVDGLRLNGLWYSALESTAADLAHAGDPAGDHFERLAGRFRRAFAKAYWCEGHQRICPPQRRGADSHGEFADVEQLLLTALPESPIPRTKRRQLLRSFQARGGHAGGMSGGSGEGDAAAGMGGVGLRVDHPILGRVESLVHRAWLGMGILMAAENPASVLREAAAVLAPLQPLLENAGEAGLAAYYRGGKPVEGVGGDPLTTAEVMGALALVRG